MIWYDLGAGVEAFSTNIGDDISSRHIVTPMHQAHSTNVAMIPEEQDHTYGVDALITKHPGVCIGVRTADCVPVLLYDPIAQAIAAIHSGWKGTANNIISCAVAKMIECYACDPARMKAVIGPCIHVEAFEVGDEVYDVFAARGYAAQARRMANPYAADSDEKWHIDLPAICEQQLRECGISHTLPSEHCTYREHDAFYSYRYCQCADRAHRIVTAIKIR